MYRRQQKEGQYKRESSTPKIKGERKKEKGGGGYGCVRGSLNVRTSVEFEGNSNVSNQQQ